MHHANNNKGGTVMQQLTKLVVLPLLIGLMFTACGDKDEEEVSASVHSKVMFMKYKTGASASMVMAYLWEGKDWNTAKSGKTVASGMFSVSTSDTINTTAEVEFKTLPAGTYYLGVFETSKMAYDGSDAALKVVGYYNTSESDYNHMMMPTGIEVSESKDYDLQTMMAMMMNM
jgi:hypothetical protein